MTNANADVTGICLHALPAREEAVIKRVITFSGSQGRNYAVAALADADILIVSDETTVEIAQLNPMCRLVRIADAGTAEPYDVLMQRPLLVTKVMRTLDEASTLLKVGPSQSADPVQATVPPQVNIEQSPPDTEEPQPTTPPPVDVKPATPSLYERIMGKPRHVAEETSIATQQTDTVPAEAPVTNSEYHHFALVVDDSAAIRKQLELELRKAGIGADFAETGEEALQKIASTNYDLIFLDIIMPGIDGYETCQQMRTRSDMKKTPIIMLSAKSSPLDEVQGVIAGASTYLTKPVKSEQLQQTLKRVSMWLDNFQMSA